MLEVLWAFREGYFTSTDDERILKRLDDDGEIIEASSYTKLAHSSSHQPCASSSSRIRNPKRCMSANVTVRHAASSSG